MKCHVILPKQIMKIFSHSSKEKGKCVYCFNIFDLIVKEGKIKTLGTKEDYYDELIEKYLSSEYEDKLGETSIKLKSLIKDNKFPDSFTTNDLNVLRDFFKITILRNPQIVEDIRSSASLARYISGFDHNLVIAMHDFVDMFERKRILFLFNTGKNSFVCSKHMIFYIYIYILKILIRL